MTAIVCPLSGERLSISLAKTLLLAACCPKGTFITCPAVPTLLITVLMVSIRAQRSAFQTTPSASLLLASVHVPTPLGGPQAPSDRLAASGPPEQGNPFMLLKIE